MINGGDPKLVLEHRDKIINVLLQGVQYLRDTPEDELLAFMRKYNMAFIEFFEDESRWLAVIAGEKVEPRIVKAEAVLIGKLGDMSS